MERAIFQFITYVNASGLIAENLEDAILSGDVLTCYFAGVVTVSEQTSLADLASSFVYIPPPLTRCYPIALKTNTVALTSCTLIKTFIFPGTELVEAFSKFSFLGYVIPLLGSGSYSLRILHNGVVICDLNGLTNTANSVNNFPLIWDISEGPTICELQGKVGGVGQILHAEDFVMYHV